jgi:transketolase
MRTIRPDVPFLYDTTTRFVLGGHQVLTEGHDLLLIASGYMVHEAKKALSALKNQSCEATLVDLYSLPFDGEALASLAQQNQGRVLTVEDNYGAGIGSAVADVLSEQAGAFTLKQLYVRRIPKSGRTPEEVLRYLGLSADEIVKAAVDMLAVTSQ